MLEETRKPDNLDSDRWSRKETKGDKLRTHGFHVVRSKEYLKNAIGLWFTMELMTSGPTPVKILKETKLSWRNRSPYCDT